MNLPYPQAFCHFLMCRQQWPPQINMHFPQHESVLCLSDRVFVSTSLVKEVPDAM